MLELTGGCYGSSVEVIQTEHMVRDGLPDVTALELLHL